MSTEVTDETSVLRSLLLSDTKIPYPHQSTHPKRLDSARNDGGPFLSVVKPNVCACAVCGNEFHDIRGLRWHVREHAKHDKPYGCNICDKTFSQLSHLKRHLMTRRKERPHICGLCSKVFAAMSALKNHIQIHTNEQPYTCVFCSKAFSHISLLRRHLRTHTKEKPYVCDLCNKPFAENSSLSRHLQQVHKKEKAHTCDLSSF